MMVHMNGGMVGMECCKRPYVWLCLLQYDCGLSQLLHTELHWLDVADRVWFKLTIAVHRCPHNTAP